MTLEEVTPFIREGHWGMLPNYKGFFKYDYYRRCVYMENGNYTKYDLDDVKHRTDYFYII